MVETIKELKKEGAMEIMEEGLQPVSPTGQYLNSSALSLTVIAILESEIPIDDSRTTPLLNDVFLPLNPRFSSIMVKGRKEEKKWKRVEVKTEEHVYVPNFPSGLSPKSYDNYFDEYLTKLGMVNLDETKPLWEIHIFKYPTTNSAGNIIFKLHHALGDGYSLMGTLLSCLNRADNPSLPLTFPSTQRSKPSVKRNNKFLGFVPPVFSLVFNTVCDFGWSIVKTTLVEDDVSPVRSGGDGVELRPFAVSTITFSLDQIKLIKSNLGVTINDVVTGMIFYGIRLYMQEANQKSSTDKTNSTALVLLNTRMIGAYKSVKDMLQPNTNAPWGNRFAFLHISIPNLTDSEISNPLSFIKQAQKVINRKRSSLAVHITGKLLETLKKFRGSEVGGRYIHRTLKNSSIAITNMIGPLEKAALDNHPIKGIYFTVAGSPQSLCITIVSYMGNLRISFGSEKGFIDQQKLKSCMENSFDKILKAVLQNPSQHP